MAPITLVPRRFYQRTSHHPYASQRSLVLPHAPAAHRHRPLPCHTGRHGRNRHPLTLNEVELPYKQAILDLDAKAFTEIKPDLWLELRFRSLQLTFDLLVEVDLTGRPSYNRDKLIAYDAFLCGLNRTVLRLSASMPGNTETLLESG